MKLALLGEEKLEDIIDYLINDYKKYNHKDISRLVKDEVVREYCMFHESESFFTYQFIFKDSMHCLDCVFYKSEYYNWIKIQRRRQKINKIKQKHGQRLC